MGLFEKIATHLLKFRLSMLAGSFVFACFMIGGYVWSGEQGAIYGAVVGILLGLVVAVATWRRLPN